MALIQTKTDTINAAAVSDLIAPSSTNKIVKTVATIANLNFQPTFAQTVNVLGYATQGDGGEGTYVYDSTYAQVNANGSSVIDPTGTGTGTGCWVKQSPVQKGSVNVLDFIPLSLHASIKDGSNTTDLSSYIQSALDLGGTIEFPTGTYLVSSTVSITSKSTIYCYGAIIKESIALTSVLTINNADGSTILGLTVEGIEDYVTFAAGAAPSDHINHGVYILSSSDCTVKDYKCSGKRNGIFIEGGDNCLIDGFFTSGLLNYPSWGSSVTYPNWTSAVVIKGNSFNKVINGHAKDIGTGVLILSPSESTTVNRITTENLGDTGVYASTCNGAVISQSNIYRCRTSGIIARGKTAIISNNNIIDCVTGVILTPSTAIADAYGAAAGDNIISSNNFKDIASFAIQVSDLSSSGVFLRDVNITDNLFDNIVTDASTYFGVDIKAHSGVKFNNNLIRNCDTTGTAVVYIQGNGAGNELYNSSITNNTVLNSTSRGFRIARFKEGVITGNFGKNNSLELFDLLYCDDSIFANNTCIDKAVVGSSSSYASSNNIFSANRGNIQIATADLSTNVILQNYDTFQSLTPITATPKTKGLITVSGGNVYMSKGTSSSADWVQVN